MRVAYLIYPEVVISNKSNGIRSQALEWANILNRQGINVDLINNWGDYNWKIYDIIHIFGSGLWLNDILRRLIEINNRIILSPIVDPMPRYSFFSSDIRYYLSKTKFFNSRVHILATLYQKCAYLCVRSEFEKKFVSKVYKINQSKLVNVPLSFDSKIEREEWSPEIKENFCLHISSIYQERKNVLRLIEAAKKYKFKLVLAGSKGSDEQFAAISNAIHGQPNISVLGFISQEEKFDLYRRAKVFALPSLQEGVGIVALDAAKMGCEIVISNIPGPKEYYHGSCIEVDPYSIDSIGQGIMSFLSGKDKFQPALSELILSNYCPSVVGNKLIKMYESLL